MSDDRPELPIKIRVTRAPLQVTTAKGALDGFDRLIGYQRDRDYAEHQAGRYTPGTATNRKQWARCNAFAIVCDEWEAVLRAYLQQQAETEAQCG